MANYFDQYDVAEQKKETGNFFDQYDPPKEPFEFSALETLKNIPGSALQYGEDILGAVTSPVETGKGVMALLRSAGNKLGRNVAEIVHGQEMEPMPEHSEEAANLVGQAAKERYGSGEAILKTLQTDPVGMLSDVAGLGAASKIPKVSKIAAGIDPLNLALSTGKTAAKAATPKSTAQRLYNSAGKFSTTLEPAKRRKIIQTALDEGIMPTEKGMVKIQDRLDVLNLGLDDLIRESGRSGQRIPVNAIFQHLNDLRATKGGVRMGAREDLAAIDRIAKSFSEHMDELGLKTVTPEQLQTFKKQAYKDINWDARHLKSEPIKEATYKNVARSAKDLIEQRVPEAQGINRQLGDLYELQPHLTRAAGRIGNRNLMSLDTSAKTGAGALVGGPIGAGIGALGSALGAPSAKARIAIGINKLKQGDIGWLEKNLDSVQIRAAMALAGRSQEEIDQILGEEEE